MGANNTDSSVKEQEVDIELIMSGAISRGLTMSDLDDLTIGQVVDYCITHNNLSSPQEEEKEGKRKATQEDWDNF